jgi:hypothetical protein
MLPRSRSISADKIVRKIISSADESRTRSCSAKLQQASLGIFCGRDGSVRCEAMAKSSEVVTPSLFANCSEPLTNSFISGRVGGYRSRKTQVTDCNSARRNAHTHPSTCLSVFRMAFMDYGDLDSIVLSHQLHAWRRACSCHHQARSQSRC